MKRAWFGLGSVALLLMLMAPLFAQPGPGGDGPVGPVGTTDENADEGKGEEDQVPGWEDLNEEEWGPLGRVDEYMPHEACDMCFTIPNYDEYSIYEYAESDVEDEAIIISRQIPNPAPEIVERDDYDPEIGGYYDPETDERVWFIGKQEIVGPTDEEKWSPALPVSTIEMKRIQARHMDRIMSIPGVHGFGIGTKGFTVDLLFKFKENLERIPDNLEGIPLEVNLTKGLDVLSTHLERIRPIPAGVSVGVGLGSGTLGPHAVRDTDTASNKRCCELLSMTAGHVLNPSNHPSSWLAKWAYSPGNTASQYNRIGLVDFVFVQTSCGTNRTWSSTCTGTSGSLINRTTHKPDIGLISYGWESVPFNNPSGQEPVRRMQYRANKSVRGPSGRTKTPQVEHKHKVWGSQTPAHSTGKVTRINQCRNVSLNSKPATPVYRYCGVNIMDKYLSQKGDSGALVAYKGEGHHYIAGVQFAITWENNGVIYTPADDILRALKNASKPISHYWGTSQSKWRPATDDGDD